MSSGTCARCGHVLEAHDTDYPYRGVCLFLLNATDETSECPCLAFVEPTSQEWGVVYVIDGEVRFTQSTYAEADKLYTTLKTNWSDVLFVHIERGLKPHEDQT